jgi:hypothetical protein
LHDDDGVVVYVDHAGIRRDRLGNFVGVVLRRQPRAGIEERSDARFPRQLPDRRGQELTVRPDARENIGIDCQRRLSGSPVSGEVVLAAWMLPQSTHRIGSRHHGLSLYRRIDP